MNSGENIFIHHHLYWMTKAIGLFYFSIYATLFNVQLWISK